MTRFAELAAELEATFDRDVDLPLDVEEFNALALEVFDHQFESNATYRRFCRSRGIGSEGVDRWEDVPAVPTTAFKHLDLVSADSHEVEAVFRTSGTTRGGSSRGRHSVPRLALYRASLLPNFRARLLPDGLRPPLLSLIPSPTELPDSSLSAMIGFVAEELCEETHWLAYGSGRLDVDGLLEVASDLCVSDRPLLLVGTAFSFVHLLDGLEARDARLALPEGTRLMETGGFKGRSRILDRDALYGTIEARLGMPVWRVVNEYGMTELLSQLYEPILTEGPQGERRHVPPPWLKVRALDPVTLDPVPEGEVGLLAFYDLANLGSVGHILTEDLGSVDRDGLRLRGRVQGAEPRGCSRAMEELMSAAEEGM